MPKLAVLTPYLGTATCNFSSVVSSQFCRVIFGGRELMLTDAPAVFLVTYRLWCLPARLLALKLMSTR